MAIRNKCVALDRIASLSMVISIVLLTSLSCVTPTDPLKAFEQGDYRMARRLWVPLAADGDPAAQNYLGVLHQLGLGVDRDYGQAVKWYRRAALAGHAGAQRNLGTMYQFGLGVSEDNFQAYVWYYSALKLGNTNANLYLQSMANKLTPNQILKAKKRVHARNRAPIAESG